MRLKKRPESPVLAADRARDLHLWSDAARYYRMELDLHPERADIWIQYGHALKESGRRSDAEAAYRAAIALEPENADAYLQLGHVLKLLGRNTGALGAYLRADTLDASLRFPHDELHALGWRRRDFGELRWQLMHADRRKGQDSLEGVKLSSIPRATAQRLPGGFIEYGPTEVRGWLNSEMLGDATLRAVNLIADGATLPHMSSITDGAALSTGRAATVSFVAPIGPMRPAVIEASAITDKGTTVSGPRFSHARRLSALASPHIDSFLARTLVMPITDPEEMRLKLQPGRRLCICAMWNPEEKLLPHRRLLLEQLRQLGYLLIAVNNSFESGDTALRGLMELSDLVILCEQGGRDIGAWITALSLVGDEKLSQCSELLLCNDSCIGPLSPLAKMHAAMERRQADVWAVSDSWDRSYHLQSYYLVLSQQAVRSGAFRHWIRSYPMTSDRQEVIVRGEVALSTMLSAAGLKLAAYCEYRAVAQRWLEKAAALERCSANETSSDAARAQKFRARVRKELLDGVPLNPTHFFWDILVEDFGSPFIKTMLALENPDRVESWRQVPEILSRFGAIDQLDALRHSGRSSRLPLGLSDA